MTVRHLWICCAVLAALTACGGDDAPDGARALFEVPEPGETLPAGYFALPYPNDLRLNESGYVDLAGVPRPNALLADYLDVIAAKQRGFGLSSGLFVRFDAPIDPASLPQDPEASRSDDSPIYLVAIDPEARGYGEKVPLKMRFEPNPGEIMGNNWLGILPFPGYVLEERTRYALIVTDRVLAKDGAPISRSRDFEIAMSDEESGDETLRRAQEIYQPLREFLDQAGGDERDDVACATVFTTQDATSLLRNVRQVVWDEVESPLPRKIRWVEETADYALYDGRYDSPRFQQGAFPYRFIANGGDIALDDDGLPEVQQMDDLRFSMSIPKGRMPEGGWPVVLYAHGTGGDYHTFVRNKTAQRMAQQGIAVVGIDQLMHGDRYSGGSVETTFFNFQNPLASRGNVLQAALEDFQLLRLTQNLSHVERRKGGRMVRFDPDRIYFFGHSQGSVTGVPFSASEPLVKGAVFSGAGGLLYLSLLSKTKPFDVTAIIALIIRDVPLDEFHPALAFLQAYYEPADAAVYGPLLVRHPPEGFAPKNIFQSLGFTDRYTPVPSIEALATSIDLDLLSPELRAVDGLALRGRQVLEPPVARNAGEVTAVLAQYDEVEGSDGHFVVFDVDAAQRQSVLFIKTLAETGTATVVTAAE
jgi:pimeloyl-ACP methyl ester carboxylesterase